MLALNLYSQVLALFLKMKPRNILSRRAYCIHPLQVRLTPQSNKKLSPTTKACVSDHASIEALLERQPGTHVLGPRTKLAMNRLVLFFKIKRKFWHWIQVVANGWHGATSSATLHSVKLGCMIMSDFDGLVIRVLIFVASYRTMSHQVHPRLIPWNMMKVTGVLPKFTITLACR